MHRRPLLKIDPATSAIEAENSRDNWSLWITGSSLELQRRLMRTNGLSPTVLVQPAVQGDAVEGDTQKLPERTLDLIAGILASRTVHSIIVCGQPDDAGSPTPMTRSTLQDGSSRFASLLQRVSARMERQRCVQDRVRAQLHQIRSHAGISSQLLSRPIRIWGMFYIPDSDVFLIYEQEKDRFVPLAVAGMWGATS